MESVPESADAERVFRDMVAQGNTLVFGTSFGYMEPMLKVAADNKGVHFEHATGYKTADNLRVYDNRTYEGAYMAGVIAGGMTKSNHAGRGRLGRHPRGDPQHRQLHAGRAEREPEGQGQGGVGQRLVRSAEGDRGRAVADRRRRRRAAAEHRLQRGAADRREERQVRVRLGFRHDLVRPEGPPGLGDQHLGGPYYIKAAKDAINGTWTTGHTWWGVKEGAIDLVSISDKVPADLKGKVDKVKAGLKDGSFSIWKGPITDNAGKEVVKKDVVADDAFLGGINFYVKGVEGQVPGGK